MAATGEGRARSRLRGARRGRRPGDPRRDWNPPPATPARTETDEEHYRRVFALAARDPERGPGKIPIAHRYVERTWGRDSAWYRMCEERIRQGHLYSFVEVRITSEGVTLPLEEIEDFEVVRGLLRFDEHAARLGVPDSERVRQDRAAVGALMAFRQRRQEIAGPSAVTSVRRQDVSK